MAKQKKQIVRTPNGVAVWPHLNKPDEYKGKKRYKVRLALEGADAEEFREYLEGKVDEAWEHYQSEAAGKNRLSPAQLKRWSKAYPFEEELDEDGEETGRLLFNFSQNAEFTNKKGEHVEVEVPLFDSKGQPMDDLIYGGSIIKIAFPEPDGVRGFYAMASSKSIGVTLDIAGVQVIDLVTGGKRTASSLGFEEEDGYEAEAPMFSNEDHDSDEGDGSSGNPDF